MNKSNFISLRIILYLIIIFLISLILYYKISTSPRFEDLLISLAATVLGIIITLLLVERSIKRNEKKEWEEFESLVKKQIIEILFTLCNYCNITSTLWENYLQIFKEEIDTKDKIIQYINFYNSSENNLDYIRKIVDDDHLIDFFSVGYKNVFNKIDDLFRLYNDKLSAKQSTLIINLKQNLFSLSNNMDTFSMFNIAIKELKAKIEIGHMNDFKENVSKTILTIKKLIEVF